MTMYSSCDSFPTKLRTSPRPKTCAGAKFNGEAGFPHSEICGSKFAHNSPQLIAACHVLHRLCMPRHPPNALTSRLRVHTANVRADDRSATTNNVDASRPLPHADDLDKNLSLLFADARSLYETERTRIYGIDFKPIHNVKECGPKSAHRPKPDLVVFIPRDRVGGAYRDRTDDLKLAKLALSQLS